VEQGDAPQALACLKEAAHKATHDSLRAMIYNEMGSLLFNEGLVCIFTHELLIKIAKAYEEVSISFHECPAVGRYGCLFIIRLSVIRRKSFGLQ